LEVQVMTKKALDAQTLLGPVPAALISCGREGGEKNIITLAWVGVVNSVPPMISIAVRPSRHSHGMIRESGEFVVNLPLDDQVAIVDGCGTLSGKNTDKFTHFNLTPHQGILTHAPGIAQCPVSLECRVRQTLQLGSHDLFIGEVVQVWVDEECLNDIGKADLTKTSLLGFAGGRYVSLVPTGLGIGYTARKTE
jgi:flavin reductase (DIM6/NTAB) family NADH-FMN oxidoreductase RutF